MTKQAATTIRLTAQGKYWGTLRIEAGRLLLDCQRHGQQVQFDLLASVERGMPVVGDAVTSVGVRLMQQFELAE